MRPAAPRAGSVVVRLWQAVALAEDARGAACANRVIEPRDDRRNGVVLRAKQHVLAELVLGQNIAIFRRFGHPIDAVGEV